MRILLLILDGLGDRPCKELNNKTPLEAAKKPNLDFLAKNGKIYSMDVIGKGIAPESDQGVLSILGYDVFNIYTGRGPLEAYGGGVKFKNGNVVVRCNFASVYNGKIQHNRIKDIESMPGKQEIEMIEGLNIKNVIFKRTVGYRGVLIIKNGMSPKITNSHPGYKIVKNFVTTALPVKNHMLTAKKVLPLDKKAAETAKIVNDFIKKSESLLKGKTILTRGAGNKLPKLRSMKDWCLIADMPVEKAIGKLSNMKVIEKPNDFKKLASVIKREIKRINVYVQIKSTDSASHKGRPEDKKKAIEYIDSVLVKELINLKDVALIVTADHSTPCSLMAHSNDPVPVLIHGIGKGGSNEFSEREARKKGKKIHGKDLLRIVKMYRIRSK